MINFQNDLKIIPALIILGTSTNSLELLRYIEQKTSIKNKK